MSAAIAAGLQLASGILTYLNTENSRKLITQVENIKLQILSEENQGYYSDDPKLETLYQQAKVLIEACQAELNLAAASAK